jgi:hypothetical protein
MLEPLMIELNDGLKCVFEPTPEGPKITMFDLDGRLVDQKEPCHHVECAIKFITQVCVDEAMVAQFVNTFPNKIGKKHECSDDNLFRHPGDN